LGQGEEAFPPIKNQNSKIENRGDERRPSKILPRRKNENSKIRNADSERRQNSEIENGKKQGPEGSAPSESVPPKIENQKTEINIPTPEAAPPIENQNSKIENAPGPEPCHFCHTDLPALLPDGERPFANCQSCGITLHSPHNRHLYCQRAPATCA